MDADADVERLIEEATALAERIGCGWWEAFYLQTRAAHSRRLGYLDESVEWLDRAYRIALERGTINQIAFVVANQATLAWLQGDVDTTYAKVVEFADVGVRGTYVPWNPFALEMAAGVAVARGITRMPLGCAARPRPGGSRVSSTNSGCRSRPWMKSVTSTSSIGSSRR